MSTRASDSSAILASAALIALALAAPACAIRSLQASDSSLQHATFAAKFAIELWAPGFENKRDYGIDEPIVDRKAPC